jgi:ribosomal protein S18 acetylase RimI-like enzyme
MGDAMHLERYLRFMRSPRYEAERDLVAVSPDGRVGSFMIWWGDPSGVAQIEPFGTHPDFQRQGIGKSLMYFGLRRMRDAGYHKVRVLTDEPREATAFYEGVGFSDVGRLRWWKPGADSRKQIMPFS